MEKHLREAERGQTERLSRELYKPAPNAKFMLSSLLALRKKLFPDSDGRTILPKIYKLNCI